MTPSATSNQRARKKQMRLKPVEYNMSPVPRILLTTLAIGALAIGAFLQAQERFTEFPMPRPDSAPTTIALAPDGTVWFTEQAGNRIGRMAPDGTGIREFELPHPGSAPWIIALGADGHMWFTEHLGNRIGRITADGTITEFPIPTPDSQPRAIALGSDG